MNDTETRTKIKELKRTNRWDCTCAAFIVLWILFTIYKLILNPWLGV